MPPQDNHEDLMETLGMEYSSYNTIKKWAAEFKRGRVSVEDDGRSDRLKGATANENVKVMPTLLMCDRRRNLHSIAREVGISFGAAQLILPNISGMSKVSARWMS